MRRRSIIKNSEGGVFLEFTVMLTLFFVFIFGMVEYMLLFWQWNAAAKAVQHGARIASVSDPVAGGVQAFDGLAFGEAGDPIPPGAFEFVCDGAALDESCSAAALRTIVYGREATTDACMPLDDLSESRVHLMGMCHFYGGIGPENVRITYEQTGLGFIARPGGPVPTITVELQDVTFTSFFLATFIDLNPTIERMLRTTVTGEDLSRTWSSST